MARTLKRFETEAEFEDWVNSPQVRTPYTCLVSETGAVHYDEGSDDDYSVTLISGVKWSKVRYCGSNCAPKYYSNTEMKSGRYDMKYHIQVPKQFVRVYKNGVYQEPKNLQPWNHIKRVYRESNNSGSRRFCTGHHGAGKCRNSIYVNEGDVIKIVFEYPIIPKGAFVDISFAKEIIIGDGIKTICRSAFSSSNFMKGTKIYVGKNVEEIDSFGLKNFYGQYNHAKIQFSMNNKKNISFYEDAIDENDLTDSSKTLFNTI